MLRNVTFQSREESDQIQISQIVSLVSSFLGVHDLRTSASFIYVQPIAELEAVDTLPHIRTCKP